MELFELGVGVEYWDNLYLGCQLRLGSFKWGCRTVSTSSLNKECVVTEVVVFTRTWRENGYIAITNRSWWPQFCAND